jgi:23S rRNA (guanosine2251-2'-O)-methyltransferase
MSIPMVNSVESLNAGVAASVTLYAIAQARANQSRANQSRAQT